MLYNSLAKATGVKIELVDSIQDADGNAGAANGVYLPGRNTIQIAMDAERPLNVVAAHEITHRMQELAPEEYRKYRDYAVNVWAERRGSSAAMVEAYKSLYAQNRVNLTTEQAMDEIAADFTRGMVEDAGLFEKLALEDRSVARRVLDALKEFVEKVKRIFKGDTEAQNNAAIERYGADIATLEEAARLWNTAMKAAQKQARTIGNTENAARTDGAARYSINEQFSRDIREWHEQGQPEGERFILGSTGAVLQGLGAIESDIYMNGDKISAILEQHPEMTVREIQHIPELLEDPVLVLKSRNVGGSARNSRLVMFGSVKAQDGRPVMCVLDLRPAERGFLLDDMQKVTSAYTKDTNPVGFISNSKVLYADKKRTAHLLSVIGFQMPISCNQSGYIGSIAYEHGNVNLTGEKFSDVVKLGEAGDAARTDGAARYSIKYDRNNNPYVVDDLLDLEQTEIKKKLDAAIP